jgi:type VI secretion system protein ImpC
MPKPPPFDRLAVEVTTRMAPIQGVPQRDVPMRIGILGDFSARANRTWSPPPPKLRDRNLARIDRDNLDQVLKKIGIELQLTLAGQDKPAVRILLAELDDFHPDRVVQQVEVFQALRGLRNRLSSPTSFAAAAAEIASWASTSVQGMRRPPSAAAVAPTPAPPPVNPGNLLEQILQESPTKQQQGGAPAGLGDWQAFIRDIVEPHTVATIGSAQQAALMARVDEATGRIMRAILHHPDFQAVEAAWRALHFLVRRLETDSQLQLYLLDISKAELAADLASADDLRSTGLYRLLLDEFGSHPWGILAGLYTFDKTCDDALLLGRLARVAVQAGAPFLAGAGCRLIGCESLAQTPDPDDWHFNWVEGEQEALAALRRLPEASYLGLALPRFLLRLPYGKESAPTDQFQFEEMPEDSSHEEYLWGHPAVLCVYLMAQAFLDRGWSFRPGMLEEVDGLPVHVFRVAGESQLKPCAEVALGERAIEQILRLGLMPLQSLSGRDAVRVPRFQALADPATPLAGRWS